MKNIIISLTILFIFSSCDKEDECRCRDITLPLSDQTVSAFLCSDEYEFRTEEQYLAAIEPCN